MASPASSPDRVVATLMRPGGSPSPAGETLAEQSAAAFPSARVERLGHSAGVRFVKTRARARLGSGASGLIIQRVGRDRHVPEFSINWRHPLALPFCCFLCILIPCVIVWRAPVIYERRHLIRSSFRKWGRSG